MARKFTQRQQELSAARTELQAAELELRQHRKVVAAAKRRLAELSRCDECGEPAYDLGGELQLCGACTRSRRRQEEIAHFHALGFGADGRLLPRAERKA
jgi:formylmethanofuran dehydrogenase subunit E